MDFVVPFAQFRFAAGHGNYRQGGSRTQAPAAAGHRILRGERLLPPTGGGWAFRQAQVDSPIIGIARKYIEIELLINVDVFFRIFVHCEDIIPIEEQ